MKAIHELEINLTTQELAKALSKATPIEFTRFWVDWQEEVSNQKLNEIAVYWRDYHYGKACFKDFIAMINYHEMKLD